MQLPHVAKLEEINIVIAPGTWHMAPGTWHLTHGTLHLTPVTWHMASVTWHLVHCFTIFHLRSGLINTHTQRTIQRSSSWAINYLAPGSDYLSPGTWLQCVKVLFYDAACVRKGPPRLLSGHKSQLIPFIARLWIAPQLTPLHPDRKHQRILFVEWWKPATRYYQVNDG